MTKISGIRWALVLLSVPFYDKTVLLLQPSISYHTQIKSYFNQGRSRRLPSQSSILSVASTPDTRRRCWHLLLLRLVSPASVCNHILSKGLNIICQANCFRWMNFEGSFTIIRREKWGTKNLEVWDPNGNWHFVWVAFNRGLRKAATTLSSAKSRLCLITSDVFEGCHICWQGVEWYSILRKVDLWLDISY